MNNKIIDLVASAVVKSGSTMREDKKDALRRAISTERNERAKWVLEETLKNAEIAEKNESPLCDDTGIPHVIVDLGPNQVLTSEMLDSINEGIIQGLKLLPGRPMGIKGDDLQRLDQSGGVSENPEDVLLAPIQIRKIEEDVIKVHVLLLGGGPAIRGKTQRVFHKHSVDTIVDEIVNWSTEGVALLGCSPSTLAIGIGRSQFEATSLMMQALIDGKHNVQSELESRITKRLNETNIGPLGLQGDTSVLATFIKVGPQRSSGIRVVCVRPNCSIEPRLSTVVLDYNILQ